MGGVIEFIELSRLVGHPDNANRQSGETFRKLVRNIERTGRYEPLVVRRHPERQGYYQVINGHHRLKALSKLGYEKAQCVVWDVDDAETDVLLSSLNRLRGSDDVGRKARLLRRLNGRLSVGELSKLLPGTRSQIERLANMQMPRSIKNISSRAFANAVVFFLNDEQQRIVEGALSAAEVGSDIKKRARRRAAALVCVAEKFYDISKSEGKQ